MSNAVLPALPGLIYPVTKTPMWRTKIQESTSGKETRIGYWSYPRWKYEIGFDVLRSGALAELQQLAGFFNARNGSFDSFLFNDPDDNAVTGQLIGAGDGATTQFQLLRALGGYAEPVQALNGAPIIYYNGTSANLVNNNSFESKTSNIPDGFTGYSTIGSTTYMNPTARSGTSAYGLRANLASGSGFLGISGNNTLTVNGITGGVRPGWQPNSTYTVSFYAKKVAGSAFGGMQLNWNYAPASTVVNANPNLTTSYQRYSFTITMGAVVEPSGTFYIATQYAGISINDELDIDDICISVGTSDPAYVAQIQSYTISSTGLITFDAPVTAAYPITWTGGYYWRCRFLEDQIDLTKFMKDLWELRSLQFQSLK